MADQIAEPDNVKAIRGLVAKSQCTFDEVADMNNRTAERFTPDRYIDENEREWYALDAICRSRPWATNKETPFAFPFREVYHAMMKSEGHWKGWAGERVWTRSAATSEVLTNLILGHEFPPAWRVLLFAPEFGNEHSFDKENWTYLEPQDNTDVWVVSWQGWTNWDEMIEQVTQKVVSFADGVSTVWFGQGMGALVAYEVMMRLKETKDTSPNLPISFVTCDCPAPHLFSELFKPFDSHAFAEQLGDVQVSPGQKQTVQDDVRLMKSYKFKHSKDKVLPVPITALCHEGNPYATEDSAKAWEAYSKEDKFEFVDALDVEGDEEEGYLRGKGYGLNMDPAVVSTVAEHNELYNRWIEDDVYPDIGPTDGPLPDEVDCVCIGAGTGGVITSCELAKSGKKIIVIDKNKGVGGVWYMHANTYSRVNTSEIGYRIFDQSEPWYRTNEDHTPKKCILKDMHNLLAKHAFGCVSLETQALKVESPDNIGGDYHVKVSRQGKEHTIKSKVVHISVNRRLGKPRIVEYPGVEHFRGKELYGYGDDMAKTSFWGKNVIVVGAGAFAFENVRTALEHGCKYCLMLCRREGTTCPKWIDMLAYLRPMDDTFSTDKAANMLSFEVWSECYKNAGLKTPACWAEGLLKPHNHTVSVSDLAFIAGFHGLFGIEIGEIAKYTEDGKGVEFKNGQTYEADLIIKCTGFHITDDAASLTGIKKMQPYGLMGFNLNNYAEPLLDGGQFGSAKGSVETEVTGGYTGEQLADGFERFKKLGFDEKHIKIAGNPFGSGAPGPARSMGKFFTWLVDHPEEQASLLKHSGEAQMNVEELWLSSIGKFDADVAGKLVASLSTIKDQPNGNGSAGYAR